MILIHIVVSNIIHSNFCFKLFTFGPSGPLRHIGVFLVRQLKFVQTRRGTSLKFTSGRRGRNVLPVLPVEELPLLWTLLQSLEGLKGVCTFSFEVLLFWKLEGLGFSAVETKTRAKLFEFMFTSCFKYKNILDIYGTNYLNYLSIIFDWVNY